MGSYKVIAFDADDTLWVNEPYFREAEQKFAALLAAYETESKIHEKLYNTITSNIPLYGYGVKSCILSMVQCAIELSNNTLPASVIAKIVAIGKEMLEKPIELLPNIKEVLEALQEKYKLIVLTKGDLLDQQNKLKRSGLASYFECVEVMSEKSESDYLEILKRLKINPKEFLMIGNSLKSDILPVVKIGAKAIHVPFASIWKFETVSEEVLMNLDYKTARSLKDILEMV